MNCQCDKSKRLHAHIYCDAFIRRIYVTAEPKPGVLCLFNEWDIYIAVHAARGR